MILKILKGGGKMKKLNIFLIAFVMLISFSFVQALKINSPVSNSNYDKRIVIFNLSSDEKTDFFYITEKSSGNWIRICQDKKECYKKLTMKEDSNSIVIRTLDSNGVSQEKKISFTVDSKKPDIVRTYPPSNSITNGNLFFIQYSENNLKEIKLNYGSPNNLKSIVRNDCDKGLDKRCDFSVSASKLSAFDGKLIDFWFSISDGVNTVDSKKMRVNVDVKSPNVGYKNYSVMNNKITFILDVTEPNLKEINYTDINDCSMKSKINGVLCKSLINGRCIAIKEVCYGVHNISIILSDKAGNINNLDPVIITV